MPIDYRAWPPSPDDLDRPAIQIFLANPGDYSIYQRPTGNPRQHERENVTMA